MVILAKELALAKCDGLIKEEFYNTTYNVFAFTINGIRKQVHLNYEEYEAYDALVEIYKCKKERALF